MHIFNAYIWHDEQTYTYNYDFIPLKGMISACIASLALLLLIHMKFRLSFVLFSGSGDYTDLINLFICNNNDECLSHPLVRLLMKTRWQSTKARKLYFMNQFLYFIFLLLLTTYIGLYSQGNLSIKFLLFYFLSKVIHLLVFLRTPVQRGNSCCKHSEGDFRFQ